MVNHWTSDIIVAGCGVLTKKEYAVKIPNEINNAFLTLLKEIKTEWLMYLSYELEESEDGKLIVYNVTGYEIPPQEANYANVKVLEAPEGEWGVIHAHQFSESKFFSGTDDSFVNANNAFSLVINKKGEFLAKTRVSVPCGKYIQQPAKVFVSFTQHDSVAEDMMSKIQKPVYKKTTYPTTGGSAKKTKASTWDTRKDSRSTTRLTRVTDRRIKDCPNMENPIQCVRTSYFDCEYYWSECPKLEGLPEQTSKQLETQEDTKEATAIVKVETEEKDLETTGALTTTKDKKEEMEEVIAEIDHPSS